MSNFREQDINAILSRAVELQKRSLENQDGKEEPSLSLEEIEAIARETEVSPRFVREAALEFEGIPVEEPLFLDTGNNSEVEAVSVVKGELDKRTWAELRSIIEYEFNSPGKTRRRPDGIIWEAQPKGITKVLETRKSVRVEINSDKGKSTIRIKKSLKTYDKTLLLPAYLFWALSVFMVAIMFIEEEVALLIFSVIFSMIGEFFRRWTNRKKKKARQHLKNTMEHLQTIMTRRFHTGPIKDYGIQSARLLDKNEENDYLSSQKATSNSRMKEKS